MPTLPVLVLFVRYPEPGKAKTRLAAGLGPEAAAAAYRCLAEHCLAELLPLAGSRVELWIYVAPAGEAARVGAWLFPNGLPPGVCIVPQPEGALVERLEQAGRLARQATTAGVLFVGTDCPGIGAGDVVAAVEGLSRHPAVLGPACDGGFWLLALREWEPGTFSEVEYSSERTASELSARLTASGRKALLLRELADVDTVADFARLDGATRVALGRRLRDSGCTIPGL